MSIDLVKRLATFVVLVLVQGLVFNHIHLFNCATPCCIALWYCISAATILNGRCYCGAL